MPARWFEIEERRRTRVGDLADIDDFAVRDAGPADPRVALRDPAISLYAVDVHGEQAVFVRLPPEHDLTTAPFVYQAQYDEAERLLVVPFDDLLALAATLPDPANPIVVYSTGRAGSTLMSRVLNEIDGVVSLSEPDVISQFAQVPRDAWRSSDDMRKLLHACLRLCAWPYRSRAGAGMAVKLRAQGVAALDLVAAAMPQVRSLFLYRNAVDYVASMIRLFRRNDLPESYPRAEQLAWLENAFGGRPADSGLAFVPDERSEMTNIEFLTRYWLASVETYLEQYTREHAAGRAPMAVPYQALDEHRRQLLPIILDHCGLPPDLSEQGLRAFGEDAQAGTAFARVRAGETRPGLSPDEIATVEAVVRSHPKIAVTDPVLPGTPELAGT